MIGIGIDTGGTCTDAVIFDTKKHEVLSASKTLTTKNDLKIGILKALNGLSKELIEKAEYISLSTTLATNACVENKGGRSKLVFIGVNPKVVERMKGTYGLPAVSDIYFMQGDPSLDTTPTNKPDWKTFRKDVKESFKNYDSIAIVQINPRYNDGKYEKMAEAIVKEETGLACVRGYDLYQEINVQRRGATALLNAKLLPIMNDFFVSIEESLAELKIDLPIVIVRSSGSVMSKEFAMNRPVETLLCGPAASVIGAMELSSKSDGLIVDMGGTTSDVALVKNGEPVTAELGICVGQWKTMVKGISIDTFALGGDSAVRYQNGIMRLDKERIIPLSMLASEYDNIVPKLRSLVSRRSAYSYPAHEFFLLINKPEDLSGYNKAEVRLIKALENGPLSFEEAAAEAGANPYVFKMRRLESQGIVIRAGITPTDVMHIYGDYNQYNVEASKLGVAYLTSAIGVDSEEICKEIYDLAKKRLYSNLVRIFMKHETKKDISETNEMALSELTNYIYDNKDKDDKDCVVKTIFSTKSALVGIGAPTKIFLNDIAHLLDTECDFPEYAHIANAIGAAMGNISAEYVVKIQPDGSLIPSFEYLISGGTQIIGCNIYEQAVKIATRIAKKRALELAKSQGAKGKIKVEVTYDEEFFKPSKYKEPIFVENTVTAKAEAILI
ncbi:MAG: hydantoinase/oxoprolinase family protein [Anaerovoracaceae bacterium]